MGALTATERREKYTAQAVEYSEVRESSFQGLPGVQGVAQNKRKGHPIHLRRGRSRRAEFRGLLDETVAVEPLPQ